MSDSGYGPIFSSLWNGSLVGRPDEQLVFIFLRCNCDRSGNVDFHPQTIASLTGIPIDRVEAALRSLESPDQRSRSSVESGARIVRLDEHRDWGWHIVNHEKYLAILKRINRNEAQNKRRHNKLEDEVQVKPGEAQVKPGEAQVKPGEAQTLDTRHEAQDRTSTHSSASPPQPSRSRAPEREPEGFAEFYKAFPRHDGRRAAAKAFANALKRLPDYQPGDLAWAAGEFADQVAHEGREPRFIPMPATWLNQDRFREFFDEEMGNAPTPND